MTLTASILELLGREDTMNGGGWPYNTSNCVILEEEW